MRIETIEVPDYGSRPNSSGSDEAVWRAIFRSVSPKRVLEFGTGSGLFLATGLPLVPEARAVTVNYPPDKEAPGKHVTSRRMSATELGKHFRGKPCESRIDLVLEDTRKVELNGNFELAMIDANHDTDFVIGDTVKVMGHLQNDSVILWHDFHPRAREPWISCVRAALNQLSKSGP